MCSMKCTNLNSIMHYLFHSCFAHQNLCNQEMIVHTLKNNVFWVNFKYIYIHIIVYKSIWYIFDLYLFNYKTFYGVFYLNAQNKKSFSHIFFQKVEDLIVLWSHKKETKWNSDLRTKINATSHQKAYKEIPHWKFCFRVV